MVTNEKERAERARNSRSNCLVVVIVRERAIKPFFVGVSLRLPFFFRDSNRDHSEVVLVGCFFLFCISSLSQRERKKELLFCSKNFKFFFEKSKG